MLVKKFVGQIRCIMGNVQVANFTFYGGRRGEGGGGGLGGRKTSEDEIFSLSKLECSPQEVNSSDKF